MPLTTFLHDRPPPANRGLRWLAFSSTILVQTKSVASDQGGGGTVTWTTSGTYMGRLEPAGGAGTRQQGGKIDERASHQITTVAGAAIHNTNRLVIGSFGTFEVLAEHLKTDPQISTFEIVGIQ